VPTRAEAFLRQARSDLRIYRLLAESGAAQCHVMQSLQMAGEKLGKALRVSAGAAGAEERTHVAAARALRLIRNRRAAADALTGGDRQSLVFIIDGCIALAHDIERLTPALAGAGSNLEYPWREPGGSSWVAPVDFPFNLARRMRGAEGHRYIALLDRIIERFDQVFGSPPAP
jgi:hypothetical protein